MERGPSAALARSRSARGGVCPGPCRAPGWQQRLAGPRRAQPRPRRGAGSTPGPRRGGAGGCCRLGAGWGGLELLGASPPSRAGFLWRNPMAEPAADSGGDSSPRVRPCAEPRPAHCTGQMLLGCQERPPRAPRAHEPAARLGPGAALLRQLPPSHLRATR